MKFLICVLATILTACGGGGDNTVAESTTKNQIYINSTLASPSLTATIFRVVNQNTTEFNVITNYGVADLNGDGLDDVVIGGGANSNGINFITILIQNPNGTLTDRTTDLVGDNKIGGGGHVFIADFDHDGYMDIYIPGGDDYGPKSSVIFWGNATRNFTRQQLGAAASHGQCLADLNGDSNVDLLVDGLYYRQTNYKGYYLNNGDRTFSALVPNLDLNGASSCAVIRDAATGHMAVLQGGNNHMPGYESSISVVDSNLNLIKQIGIPKQDATMAGLITAIPVDVNGDGLVDLVLAWENFKTHPYPGRKEVWFNQGNDNFVYGYTLDTAHNMPGDWVSFTYQNELYVFFDAPGGDAVLYRRESGKLVPYKTESFKDMLVALGADPITGAWLGAHAVASATVYRGRDGLYMLQKLASGLYTKKL